MQDFYTEKTVKARKTHRCFHCKKDISIGDKYIKVAGVYEGDFFSHKSHELCQKALEKILDISNEREFDCDTLRYGLEEDMCRNCEKSEDCDKDVFECMEEWLNKFNA